MATAVIPPPPPGFTLDPVASLPPGFVLDSTPAAASPRGSAFPRMEDTIPGQDPAAPTQESVDAAADDVIRQVTGQPDPTAPSGRWSDALADFGHDIGISPITDPLIGGAEVALSGLSNIGGKILGGVTGLGQILLNPFQDPNEGAANTMRAVEEFFTYQPGERGQDLVAPVGEALGGVMDRLPQDAVTQTAVPAFAETVATLAPTPKLARGAGRATEAVAPKQVVLPGEGLGDTLGDLRAAGYPVRPSDVQRFNPGKKVPGTTREKFSPDDTRHEMTLKSQAKTNEIVGRDLGLEPGARLDESFESLKAPEFATYEMAEKAAAGKPLLPELRGALEQGQAVVKRELLQEGGAPSITRTLSALRRRASKELADERIEVQDRGFETQALADRIEEAFGRQLEAVGEPQLLAEFRAARERLAKIHDVENSSRAGQVDAAALRKLDEKFPGRLTGGLKLAAKANEYLPDVTGSTMSSAGRPGGTFDIPRSKPGAISSFLQAVARRLPGMDVTSPGFQAKHFGPEATPDFISQYGRREQPFEIVPQQRDLGLGEALALEPAPGVAPARRVPTMPEAQPELGLGEALALEPPGRLPPDPNARVIRDIRDLMVMDEPLLVPPPDVARSLSEVRALKEASTKKKRKD